MQEIRCPSCGYTHVQDGKIEFCPNCGSNYHVMPGDPPVFHENEAFYCFKCGTGLDGTASGCPQCRTDDKRFNKSAFKAIIGILGVFLFYFVLTLVVDKQRVVMDIFWMRGIAALLILILFIRSCVGLHKKCSGKKFYKMVKVAFPVSISIHCVLNIAESLLVPAFVRGDTTMSTLNIVLNIVLTLIFWFWWGFSYKSFQTIYQAKTGRK